MKTFSFKAQGIRLHTHLKFRNKNCHQHFYVSFQSNHNSLQGHNINLQENVCAFFWQLLLVLCVVLVLFLFLYFSHKHLKICSAFVLHKWKTEKTLSCSNTSKRLTTSDHLYQIRHRETRVTLYNGLKPHAKGRQKRSIQTSHSMGLPVSHARVIEV